MRTSLNIAALVLITGTFGCAPASWITVEPETNENNLKWVRITLDDDFRLTLKNATVTDEEISGASNGREYRVSRSKILKFETPGVAEKEPDPVKSLEIGDRVLITSHDMNIQRYDGTIVSIANETIVVDSLQLPLRSLTELYVHRGKKAHALGGALIGLLIGASTAGGFTQATYPADDGYKDVAVMVTGGAGAIVGAIFGAAVGSQILTDRWEVMNQFELNLAPTPDGQITAGVTIRF